MAQFIQTHETVLLWMGVSSLITFIATLIVVPLLVVRIPPDYFVLALRQRPILISLHPVMQLALKIGRNMLGFIFIGVGIILLVLPGQGVLTILVGIMLMNFPGKDRLVRWIVSRELVLRSINWIRRRARKPSLSMTA